MPGDYPALTQPQAVTVATRVIACYLVFWVLTDLIAMPRELLALWDETHRSLSPNGVLALPAPVDHTYLHSTEGFLIENLVRIVLWASLANWFYRCGPTIQRILGLNPQTSPTL